MADTAQLFAAAVAHHQAGRWQQADQLYQQVLAAEPQHAGAWHFRGVLAAQAGQIQTAINSVARALELQPGLFEAHNNLGLIFESAGRLSEAALCFHRAIALNPSFAAAHSNLGSVLTKQGQWNEAIESNRRAIELQPQSAPAYYNLAVALQNVNDRQAAILCYRRVIELNPNHAEACNNLGVLLMGQSNRDEAAAFLRQAIAIKSDYVEAYNNLGTLLVNQGKLDDARALLERAIELKPDYAEAHATRGNICKALGQLDVAIACYQRAVELKPELSEAYCNLGNSLAERGDIREAGNAYSAAIRRDPNHAMAHFGLGYVLLDQGRESDAIACFRRTIELQPDYAAAYINLSAALRGQEKWDEIADCCRRAIALRPDFAEGYINLANAFSALGRPDEAAAAFQQVLAINSQSSEAYSAYGNIMRGLGRVDEAIAAYRRAIELKPGAVQPHCSLLYSLYFSPSYDAAQIYEEHRSWNEQYAQPLAKSIQPHANDPNPDRRLRIGYFAPDFRDHCQSFFTLPLFSNHNHEQFEVFVYALVSRPDHITNRLRPLADHWRDIVGVPMDQVVQQIRHDQIDIMVDLTLLMDKGAPLLFARKPAPVQVCWLGYPGTTGLTTMDYRFTDPYLDPHGLFDRFYSEESIRLPHTFWCYDPINHDAPFNTLPALNNGCMTFGCLNNFCKVNDGVLRLWAKVMNAVERSRLILMVPEGSARTRTLELFAAEGVSTDRISFVRFQPRPEYLATYHKIDIGLETLPYNGHTTSLDSFWMGVPVPTLVGQTVVGRAGVCLLENLGLRELIGQTPDEYVEVVGKLAGDLPCLRELRAGLRERMEGCPLMDGPQFARDIEAAYRQIWQRWCTKQTATPA